MAFDDIKQAQDDLLSADWNALITYLKLCGIPGDTGSFLGSTMSGSDGGTGRTVTISNTRAIKTAGHILIRNGAVLDPDDYTISSDSSDATLTIDNVNIFDADKVRFIYFT